MMKKVILFISTIFIGLVAFTSCKDDDFTEPAKELKLKTNEISVFINKKVEVEIMDGNGGYKFIPSNKLITASLKENTIIIEGKDVGTSELVVTDSKMKKSVIKVTVLAEDVTLDSNKSTVNKGDKILVDIAKGSGAYTVSSADKSIATANIKSGKVEVEGLKKGEVIITVTDTKTNKKTTFVVSVTVDVLAIDESETQFELLEGKTKTITITKGSGDYTVSSENEVIASVKLVNSAVIITAGVSSNKYTSDVTKVTLKDTQSGDVKEFTIKVYKSLSIGNATKDISLNIRKTADFEIESGDISKISIISSNKTIVTGATYKDSKGVIYIKITAKSKDGFEKITVSDGIKSIVFSITVKKVPTFKITDIVGNEVSTLNIEKGKSVDLLVNGSGDYFLSKPFDTTKLTVTDLVDLGNGTFSLTVTAVNSGYDTFTIHDNKNIDPNEQKKIKVTVPFVKLSVSEPVDSTDVKYVHGLETVAQGSGVIEVIGTITMKLNSTIRFTFKDGFDDNYFYNVYDNATGADLTGSSPISVTAKNIITTQKFANVTANQVGTVILRFADWGTTASNKTNIFYKVIVE